MAARAKPGCRSPPAVRSSRRPVAAAESASTTDRPRPLARRCTGTGWCRGRVTRMDARRRDYPVAGVGRRGHGVAARCGRRASSAAGVGRCRRRRQRRGRRRRRRRRRRRSDRVLDDGAFANGSAAVFVELVTSPAWRRVRVGDDRNAALRGRAGDVVLRCLQAGAAVDAAAGTAAGRWSLGTASWGSGRAGCRPPAASAAGEHRQAAGTRRNRSRTGSPSRAGRRRPEDAEPPGSGTVRVYGTPATTAPPAECDVILPLVPIPGRRPRVPGGTLP